MSDVKPGQDPHQETIAELTACALAAIYDLDYTANARECISAQTATLSEPSAPPPTTSPASSNSSPLCLVSPVEPSITPTHPPIPNPKRSIPDPQPKAPRAWMPVGLFARHSACLKCFFLTASSDACPDRTPSAQPHRPAHLTQTGATWYTATTNLVTSSFSALQRRNRKQSGRNCR